MCGAPKGTGLGKRILKLPAATHRVPAPDPRVPPFCKFLLNIGVLICSCYCPTDLGRQASHQAGKLDVSRVSSIVLMMPRLIKRHVSTRGILSPFIGQTKDELKSNGQRANSVDIDDCLLHL